MPFDSSEKITMLVFSLYPGGAEKVCLTLCNEFAKRNYETELWIVNSKETILSKQLNENITVFKMNKKHVRTGFFPLLKLLVQRKPKQILIFHIELAVLVLAIKRLLFLKTKVIVRSINTLSQAFNYPSGLWERFFARRVIKQVLPMSNRIIAQSKGMHDDLVKFFRFEQDKLITIPNPAKSIYLNGTKIHEIKSRNNEFLFVGRLSPQKGLENLVKAFKIAHNQNSSIRLTIVGDGIEKGKISNLVKEFGLTDSVVFEGFQENTIPYFLQAKATVLTSHFEGFPNVLLESITAGTPVISFNCPSGPEDIIIENVNGILVPHLNVDAFAKALLQLANNEIQFNYKEVVESSKRFSMDTVFSMYEQVLIKN